MARPKAMIDEELFLKLYEKGFSDLAIANYFSVHRSTIVRKRQQLSLSPTRGRGERGPGRVQPGEPYHKETLRLLKYVGPLIREQAEKMRYRALSQADQEIRERLCLQSWLATGVCSLPIPHLRSGKGCSLGEGRFLRLESLTDKAGLAGVPGISILELARIFSTKDEQAKKILAKQAILEAGYVGPHETVAQVLCRGLTGYDQWKKLWKEQRELALKWTMERQKKYRCHV